MLMFCPLLLQPSLAETRPNKSLAALSFCRGVSWKTCALHYDPATAAYQTKRCQGPTNQIFDHPEFLQDVHQNSLRLCRGLPNETKSPPEFSQGGQIDNSMTADGRTLPSQVPHDQINGCPAFLQGSHLHDLVTGDCQTFDSQGPPNKTLIPLRFDREII